MNKSKIAAIAIIAGLMAAIVGLVAWRFVGSLDRRIAELIETHGSAMTGTKVRVAGVDLDLSEGQGRVRGLRVDNPEGFASGHAIEFDDIAMTIDLGTLRKNPIVIEELVVGSPRIGLDVNAQAKANLDELKRRVEKNAGGAPDPDPTRFRIKKLTIQGGTIKADLRATGGKVEELDLDTIRRSDIGGARGATSDEVAKLLVTAVAKESMKAAAQAGLSNYLDKSLGGKAGGLTDKVKGIFK